MGKHGDILDVASKGSASGDVKNGFREAMSRLGAAVHVITSAGTAGRCGFTASSVCSVTDEPPTVLVCLNRSSSVHGMFRKNGVFCINTLGAGHEAISDAFAGFTGSAMDERFAATDWQTLATGAPAMTDALVSIDCRISSITEIGTHSVIFGAVQAIRFGQDNEALMYLRRAYHKL